MITYFIRLPISLPLLLGVRSYNANGAAIMGASVDGIAAKFSNAIQV